MRTDTVSNQVSCSNAGTDKTTNNKLVSNQDVNNVPDYRTLRIELVKLLVQAIALKVSGNHKQSHAKAMKLIVALQDNDLLMISEYSPFQEQITRETVISVINSNNADN